MHFPCPRASPASPDVPVGAFETAVWAHDEPLARLPLDLVGATRHESNDQALSQARPPAGRAVVRRPIGRPCSGCRHGRPDFHSGPPRASSGCACRAEITTSRRTLLRRDGLGRAARTARCCSANRAISAARSRWTASAIGDVIGVVLSVQSEVIGSLNALRPAPYRPRGRPASMASDCPTFPPSRTAATCRVVGVLPTVDGQAPRRARVGGGREGRARRGGRCSQISSDPLNMEPRMAPRRRWRLVRRPPAPTIRSGAACARAVCRLSDSRA